MGTLKYASVAAHFGQVITPKDDIESLGYMLIFMHTSMTYKINLKIDTLPWMKNIKDKENIFEIGIVK